jgi:FkbH-like protein
VTDAQANARASTLLAELDERPTVSRIVSTVRKLERLHAESPGTFRPLRVAFVRNATIEPLEPALRLAAYRRGVHLEVTYSGYDPTPAEVAALAPRPDVVVVALWLEQLAPALAADFLAIEPGEAAALAGASVERVVALTRAAREQLAVPVAVQGFAPPGRLAAGLADAQNAGGQRNIVRRMNLQLVDELAGVDGATIFDLEHVMLRVGIDNALDERNVRAAGAPLSGVGLRAVADALVRHLLAVEGPAAKCLVLDCDGTLWGGIVGEDGIGGIALGESGRGRRYRDFQQQVVDLARRGVVVMLCSKNEEADVLEVLRKHPDCLLKEDLVAAHRINWDDKATNIRALAAEVGLGLQHVVFVDDSPFECEWVASQLPEVRVVALPTADDAPPFVLDDLGLFDSIVVTEEDRARTAMYQAESRRRRPAAGDLSMEDHLRSLGMRATLGLVDAPRLQRVAQLTQKTNQFNLTTRRNNVADIERMARDPSHRIVWLELHDRFGSAGLVGCGIVRAEGTSAAIDTCLLSCRVIGRHVESVLVRALAQVARTTGATRLVGEYRPTSRNGQVADLYPRLGFAPIDSSPDSHRWAWRLESGDPPAPDWFDIEDEGLITT